MSLLTSRPHSLSGPPMVDRAARHAPPMPVLVFRAYLLLVLFDVLLMRGDFLKLYQKIRDAAHARTAIRPEDILRVSRAFDLASICYWKQILCLQRSAAIACLLKQYGIRAELVIGAQAFPFKAHAWVEVAGCVVGDKPYTHEMYQVLDRC
jgi:hypothetical protein